MAMNPPGGASAAKKKPIPTLYYVAGGAALLVIYFLWSKSKTSSSAAQSAAAAAAQTAAAAATPVPTGTYDGSLAAALPYLQPPASAPLATSSGIAPVGSQSGSGFLPVGQSTGGIATNPGTYTATDNNGNTYTWLNPSEWQAYTASGGTAYYEPIPGVFQPVSGAMLGTLGPNTPLYAAG
jgi:hypothetical protein